LNLNLLSSYYGGEDDDDDSTIIVRLLLIIRNYDFYLLSYMFKAFYISANGDYDAR